MVQLFKWMLCKRGLLFSFIIILPSTFWGQSLTLEQAYDLARKNYPMIKQKDLVNQTAEMSIENLNKGYLPQICLTRAGHVSICSYRTYRSRSRLLNSDPG